MADRYIKTDSGRAEIRARVHAITRTARNLLLIIDASRDGSEWVGMVRGAATSDLKTLVDAGLIVPVPVPVAGVATPAPPAAPVSRSPVEDATAAVPAALAPLSYSDLYDLLPSLAKEHLGLMKGYRFALSIEKARGLADLQQVAVELIAEVERVKGTAVARSVKRALLM
jgi:hypothetical protein